MATWFMFTFQDTNSYVMTVMNNFYDFMIILLMVVLLFIFYIMLMFFSNEFICLNVSHSHICEVVWTFIPMGILVLLAIPSLKILYMMEEVLSPLMTVKILGHQWYWSYEYSDFSDLTFDSFMIKGGDSDFRLLEVDNRLVMPCKVDIRGLVSSLDVIHSWAMPSMGVKVDAFPGRVNQIIFKMDRPGLFFGQCSEICGMNHSFMPIVLESIDLKNFFNWAVNFKGV